MAILPVLPSLLASVGDAEGERTVTSIVALLTAIGLGLLMVAVWLYRTTRPDPEVLAPLEAMSDRGWRRADPVAQRRRLDALRPEGARPLQPSVAPPEIDEAFDLGPAASGFDDLHDRDVDGEGGHGAVDLDEVAERLGLAVRGVDDGPPRSIEVPTPTGTIRPAVLEEFDDDFDPDLLASALADLDVELGAGRERADGSD